MTTDPNRQGTSQPEKSAAERARELLGQATPGPWSCYQPADFPGDWRIATGPNQPPYWVGRLTQAQRSGLGSDPPREADARFIAESRTLIPQLLQDLSTATERAEKADGDKQAALNLARGFEEERANLEREVGRSARELAARRVTIAELTERTEKAEREREEIRAELHAVDTDYVRKIATLSSDNKQLRSELATSRAAHDKTAIERDKLHGELMQARATLAKHDEVGAKNLGDFLTLTAELKVTREVSHLWARLFARCALEYGLDVDLDLAADAELKGSLMEFRGNLPGLCAAAREHGWRPLPLPPKETT